MSSKFAIKVEGLSKCYQIYDQPRDRLKQFVLPRLQTGLGLKPKQYYREFWALNDVTFEVKKGETVGIIGRNGSGKSTLLQVICGTLNPTGGTVQTNGRIAALLELGSGFNPDFTGRENVYMNASVLGLSKEEIDIRFDDISAFADIGDFIEQPVKTYSSGMLLRLAFAVIAHVDAEILIVDEALAVGDAFFTQKCMRYLRDFMKKGTVLFVSHDTGAVVNLCNKAIMLDQGLMVEIGRPKDVIELYLASVYASTQEVDGVPSETSSLNRHGSGEAEYRDLRDSLINSSNLRNDIEVFRFSPDKGGFGTGDAEIVSVNLLDREGVPLSWVVGGEDVVLNIRCIAHADITRPIVGFQFMDRLGQIVFADNSYLVYRHTPCTVSAGNELVANFEFRFPILPTGDYSFSVAVANGSQNDHTQLHWKHDALTLKAQASSVCFGLVGIPMKRISLETSR